jgi:hypothetical protein
VTPAERDRPYREAFDAHPGLLAWVCEDAREGCALALVYHLTGVHLMGARLDETPYNAGEASACLDMLDAAPTLRALLPRLAEVDQPAWQVLGKRWAAIEALLQVGDYDAAHELLP